MKSKRGFTLIELLAIIVILAIIAVITVPIILNIVEDATKNAAVDSAYGYKDAINKFYASKLLQDKDYYIPSGSYYVDGDNGYLEGTETLDIAVSGKIPSFGKVIIGNGSKVGEMQLCINDYMVSFIDEEMNVVKGCTPVEPGLYDQSNNLVVSYDYLVSEYGFDPSIDVSSGSGTGSILANYSNGVKLILPDTLTKIGERAFYNNTDLISIIIPSSVTSIGESAFENMNLTSITIPSNVISIGNYAFYGCRSLSNVTFESGSQLASIGSNAFNNNEGLTSITIPASVISIGKGAFSGCSNLRSVTFESGSQLTSIGQEAFYSSPIASITIPSSVTSIGSNAFSGTNTVYYSGSATGAPWGAINYNPYTDGDFVYNNSSKTVLKGYLGTASSVTIPASVTSIGNDAFYHNTNLKSVTFESGSQLTSIGEWAFAWSGLESITIPSSVTSIGQYAFYHCTNLTNVAFENGSGLKTIGESAFENTNLASITIPSGVTSIGRKAFYYSIGSSSVTIPSSVTSIGSNAFSGVKVVYYTGSATGSPWGALSVNPYIDGDFVYSDNTKTVLQAYLGTASSVTIPSSVTSIEKKVFSDNKDLTSVTIPSGVTSIGNNAFSGCYNLESVTFESGSQLTSIGNNAFYSTGLISITIPSSVTSIGSWTFGNSQLKLITIPSSVTSIGNKAFNSMKVVYYTGSATGSPWGANSVNPYVDGDFAYSDNTKTSLLAYLGADSSVTIPSSVTSIGNDAFYNNKNLTSVTIPSSVTSIGNNAFYYCSNLRSVTFESGSQLTSIGSEAFSISGLTSITIPSGVTSIGNSAFRGINIVYYSGSATGSPWGAKSVVSQ